MKDHFNFAHGIPQSLKIAHVSTDELNVFRQVVRNSCRMHLLSQAVVDPDSVAGLHKGVGQMRSDETSSARDENCLCHHLLLLFRSDLHRSLRRGWLALPGAE